MIHLTGQQFSPKEIIQQIFSPMIGVVCSPQAEEICHKNNLTFVELLQPFSKLSTDGMQNNSIYIMCSFRPYVERVISTSYPYTLASQYSKTTYVEKEKN